MSNKIKMISINKLHPHPDNPRKDLGDLEELAESIKSQGILQNLTVVPWFSLITRVGCDFPEQQEKMGYRIVIGHRRRAAAEIAGLTELPCIITEMTPQEQVATMLLENMQRTDLTIYEQAQGFQMMINFGETMENIAEKTGFSETTVRRRVKLLELDQEKFKETTDRGATLTDYMELFEIKDAELRNEVLEKLGTGEYDWALRRAKDKEKRQEWEKKITSQLDEFATRVEEIGENYSVERYYNDTASNYVVEKPEDTDTRKYVYQVYSYGQIKLSGENKEIKDLDKRA